jgi:hypothetical protein
MDYKKIFSKIEHIFCHTEVLGCRKFLMGHLHSKKLNTRVSCKQSSRFRKNFVVSVNSASIHGFCYWQQLGPENEHAKMRKVSNAPKQKKRQYLSCNAHHHRNVCIVIRTHELLTFVKGDQIGRIVANFVAVFFGHFLKLMATQISLHGYAPV